ncbi:DnaJ like subfamily B member 12 [Fusarium proliferatum]|uniref:DnaJ like subfamily B member 12 n=1 Tax=Gibberella intermedia TaxID=948311 RepID=A0A365MRX3_GIBIN|nr:DnaJ like subfamily B member 12 [Fusarium proliferatum]KAG4279286.1 DnaJ like subfamily B member 12 [Fusarium proliferatum]KAG4295099.1 DnaJ like subfamily B member 12 [Fusarium proliferatum]RBA11290.1 DnaJ like subfamily B member 12 [Fusarium proliferatum]
MPSATASGADTGGSARSRDHKQGNQGRSFTPDQEAAVIRIRRCEATAFYDILNLSSVKDTCTEAEIKKAYRKLSLLTHPDKNGHPHADEAFKMVSRAFGILGDKEKREKFDKFGTDPDSRFASAQANNPFFNQRAGGGGMGRGGPMFQDDLTPEEMFARFFGGGGFGGADRGRQNEGNAFQTFLGLLPIILFFILPIITSFFSGESSTTSASGPRMVYDNPLHPYTEQRTTPNLNVNYYVNPEEVAQYSEKKLNKLDRTAEHQLLRHLKNECENELIYQRRLRDAAQGWFYQDPDKMALAQTYTMPSCERLQNMGVKV